jgi:hypothetical protein
VCVCVCVHVCVCMCVCARVHFPSRYRAEQLRALRSALTKRCAGTWQGNPSDLQLSKTQVDALQRARGQLPAVRTWLNDQHRNQNDTSFNMMSAGGAGVTASADATVQRESVDGEPTVVMVKAEVR